ncbi:MAG: hypothetical protein IIW32_06340, partial [Bacteroides sp.]|nr:hypothetical protein [Bacteroides sp.]
VLVGEVMLSIPMTEGAHEVELRYENKAYEYGLLISVCCAAVFGGICLGAYLIRSFVRLNMPLLMVALP